MLCVVFSLPHFDLWHTHTFVINFQYFVKIPYWTKLCKTFLKLHTGQNSMKLQTRCFVVMLEQHGFQFEIFTIKCGAHVRWILDTIFEIIYFLKYQIYCSKPCDLTVKVTGTDRPARAFYSHLQKTRSKNSCPPLMHRLPPSIFSPLKYLYYDLITRLLLQIQQRWMY